MRFDLGCLSLWYPIPRSSNFNGLKTQLLTELAILLVITLDVIDHTERTSKAYLLVTICDLQ